MRKWERNEENINNIYRKITEIYTLLREKRVLKSTTDGSYFYGSIEEVPAISLETLEEKIDLLTEHLGMEFIKKPATDSRLILKKKKKKS